MRKTMLTMAAAGVLGACAASGGTPSTLLRSPEPVAAETLGAQEFMRFELRDGDRYRVEVEGKGAEIRLRGLEPGMMQPLVAPFFSGTSGGRVAVYEVTPRATGTYQLSVEDPGDAAWPVKVRVERTRVRG